MRSALRAAALMLMLAACGPDESGPVTVSEVTAYAPLPGQPAGVAYFSLHNGLATAVTLHRVSSPEFADVQMHTTLMDGGVARMTPLDLLTVAERSVVRFAPGGPHLMLLEPLDGLGPGDLVTLEFHYEYEEYAGKAGARDALAVQAPLQSR